MKQIDVGILGGTGMVGQHFIRFLQGHPWFNLTWLGASDRSAGKKLKDATSWRLDGDIPSAAAEIVVSDSKPSSSAPRLVFSAMDASVATEIERDFAQAGHIIVSNSRNHRMEADVPLIVPEVNPGHLELLRAQQKARSWKGMIVTNPNCSTVVLTMALAPLLPFGVQKVIVATLQAISGAGYPGVASMDIMANVVPYIGSEEEKMEQETQKILGTLANGAVSPLAARVSAHCNRVAVVDGHLITTSVELSKKPSVADVQAAIQNFQAVPQQRKLPSAPAQPLTFLPQADRPQPRRDAMRENGMGVTIGRVRECPVLDIKLVACGQTPFVAPLVQPFSTPNSWPQKVSSSNMIVMKFGGTSVESREAITRVTSIVKKYEERRPIVVVSAMGKTTNKLLAAAQEAAAGRRDQALTIVDELRGHHLSHGLPLAGPAAADLDRFIRTHFEWLEELVKGLSVVGELSDRSKDAIASIGERLSSLVVSFAFRAAGMPTQHVDSRRMIVTDDRFTQAQVLFDETYAALTEKLRPIAEHSVVVMGGFIASTKNGVTTTLGRGGSDYSAALVGAGVNAEEIQIWTDVDGMLTADPRIIPGGHRVKSISFAEAAEMAFFGAKVLHPATVLPAVEKNIPVLILNSKRPEVDGTRITLDAAPCANPVKSISCKRDITILNIRSTRMLMAHGFLRRIFEIFDRYETSVDMLSTSEVSVSLTLDNTEYLNSIREEVRQFAEVTVEEKQAIVCLVGENIRHTPGIAGRAFQVLADKNVRMISQGASLLNLGFVIADSDLVGAVSALHKEFFSTLDPAVFA